MDMFIYLSIYSFIFVLRLEAVDQKDQNATTSDLTNIVRHSSTAPEFDGDKIASNVNDSATTPKLPPQEQKQPCGHADISCDKDLLGQRVAYPGDCRRYFICSLVFTEETGSTREWLWKEYWCPAQHTDTPYLFQILNPLALNGDCVQRQRGEGGSTCEQVTGDCELTQHQGYVTEKVTLPAPLTTPSVVAETTAAHLDPHPPPEDPGLSTGVLTGVVIAGVIVVVLLTVLICWCFRRRASSSRAQKRGDDAPVDMNDPTYQDSDMLQAPFLSPHQEGQNTYKDVNKRENGDDPSQLYSLPIKDTATNKPTESMVIKENSMYSPSITESLYHVASDLPKTAESSKPRPLTRDQYEQVDPVPLKTNTVPLYDSVPIETDSNIAPTSLQPETSSNAQNKTISHNYEEVVLDKTKMADEKTRPKSEKSHYYELENPEEWAHYKNIPDLK